MSPHATMFFVMFTLREDVARRGAVFAFGRRLGLTGGGIGTDSSSGTRDKAGLVVVFLRGTGVVWSLAKVAWSTASEAASKAGERRTVDLAGFVAGADLAGTDLISVAGSVETDGALVEAFPG